MFVYPRSPTPRIGSSSQENPNWYIMILPPLFPDFFHMDS